MILAFGIDNCLAFILLSGIYHFIALILLSATAYRDDFKHCTAHILRHVLVTVRLQTSLFHFLPSFVFTRRIYLSRGVKQGCSLSPMLFALYISDMGFDLSNCGEGFDLQGVKICSLFFADDIVLFSPTAKGLKFLIKIVKKHCDLLKKSF